MSGQPPLDPYNLVSFVPMSAAAVAASACYGQGPSYAAGGAADQLQQMSSTRTPQQDMHSGQLGSHLSSHLSSQLGSQLGSHLSNHLSNQLGVLAEPAVGLQADTQPLSPMGHYLSTLGLYQRRHTTCTPQYHLPPASFGAASMASAAFAAIAAAGAAGLADGTAAAAGVAPAGQSAATTLPGMPVATTATTPALFVSAGDARGRTLSAQMHHGLPVSMVPVQQQQQQQQQQHALAGSSHSAFTPRADSMLSQLASQNGAASVSTGAGEAQGLLRGHYPQPGRPEGRRLSTMAGSLAHGSSLVDGAVPTPTGMAVDSPVRSRHADSPTSTAAQHTTGDAGPESIITMDDLIERGTVVRLQQSPEYLNIPAELLAAGRSSITVGAAVGADKRRFNLKWLYDYSWLQFDPTVNAMFCTLCKQGKRANQFAKKGSRNFKTSAIVDHSSSNDHRRSVAQVSEASRGHSLVLALQNGTWSAVTNPFAPAAGVAPVGSDGAAAVDGADQAAVVAEPQVPKHEPVLPDTLNGAGAAAAADPALAAASAENPAAAHAGPMRATHIGTQSTSGTFTAVSSRHASLEGRDGETPISGHQQPTQQHKLFSPVEHPPAGRSKMSKGHDTPRSTTSHSSSFVPDERYAKEFEHAVQALLQAMELNLPISAVADLYQLMVSPTPLAGIGSTGYSTRTKHISDAAGGRESGGNGNGGGGGGSTTGLRLAGAITTDTVVSARLLQHVVSSEILSLVKDEVSQSPAFSVIIDEAPLREHNSLVAHVLLYLRYMRHDPQSNTGKLQVVTRFWRCVHLYHESDGRLARRDPSGMVLGLLDRGKIDTSRLVCIACERPVGQNDEVERRRPHVIYWRGLFTYPNSLSPQVYEEIAHQSDDFVSFAMALSDLCVFIYSHPSSFAFLGDDFLEMLYKTLYEIFLSEGTLSTRLPISLTPSIVIAITRNISQIMATVLALSKLPRDVGHAVARQGSNPHSAQGSGDLSASHSSPITPRPSFQTPLALVDAISLYDVRRGRRESAGKCPPADVLFEQLRNYSFLGCLHFMADILYQVKPVIASSEHSDTPTQAFSEQAADPSEDTLDQRLRSCLAAVKETIESVTLMYGDDEDGSQDYSHGGLDGGGAGGGGGEEEFSGFHLNEFLHLTGKNIAECSFRSFQLANYSHEDSQARLVELIRTVSSAILKDLNQRFSAVDLATIQELADMWNPTQFPRDRHESAEFANDQAAAIARKLSRVKQDGSRHSALGVRDIGMGDGNPHQQQTTPLAPSMSDTPLVNAESTIEEWRSFKYDVCQKLDEEDKPQPTHAAGEQQEMWYSPESVQHAFSNMLFPRSRLAPSRRKLRAVNGVSSGAVQPTEAAGAHAGDGWSGYSNLTKLATAWHVLPMAISIDLHKFRRLYEQQLHRICRDQAEAKLQPASYDMDDTFFDLLRRMFPPQAKNKVSVYALLQNSKLEVSDSIDSQENPVDHDLFGGATEHFLRIIDAVTLALDHRLRLLSIGHTETPLALPRAPGECPKWIQNAMRGYWKLACRPPESSAFKGAAPPALRYASHGSRCTPVAQISASSSGGASHGFDSGSQTATGALRHNLHLDIGSRLAATNPIDRLGTSTHSSTLDSPLPPRIPPSLSAGACGALSKDKPSLFTSSAIGPAMAAAEDLSTLPLLEALLSEPTSASVNGGHQKNPSSATSLGGFATPKGATRRSDDEQQLDSVAASATTAASAPVDALRHAVHRTPSAVTMEAPPAKRARHSDMAITVNSNYLGLQHLGHSFAQHQHPGSGGHGDFLLSSEIAQLASGMRFDSASNQEVTASLSAQSGHTIPAQSLVGVAAPDPLRVGANHPGYLRHDEPALVPASFALPTSADGSAYAAAMAAAVAAARTSMPQSQYAALGALNVPSLPAAPQAYAVPHMDHGPPLGPRMAEMQHPLPTMASASSSAIAGSIPPQPSDCQAHYGPVSGSSRR